VPEVPDGGGAKHPPDEDRDCMYVRTLLHSAVHSTVHTYIGHPLPLQLHRKPLSTGVALCGVKRNSEKAEEARARACPGPRPQVLHQTQRDAASAGRLLQNFEGMSHHTAHAWSKRACRRSGQQKNSSSRDLEKRAHLNAALRLATPTHSVARALWVVRG
jgi:hypothetical protein